jgi:hypothetical protein
MTSKMSFWAFIIIRLVTSEAIAIIHYITAIENAMRGSSTTYSVNR